jgi:hypothetical protein
MKRRFVMRIKQIPILLLGLFFSFISMACVGVGEREVHTQIIELGSADNAIVELAIGAGELEVHGGARELMEATFTYNVNKWKPKINHRLDGEEAVLKVRQGKAEGIPLGDTENRWDISLNQTVPMDLRIDMGAGKATLDLRDIRLNDLDIEGGVGELILDLSGERGQDLDVDIEGGIGSATITLPEELGVRIRVDGGIGSVDAFGLYKDGHVYTNETYGNSEVEINIQIDVGIGSIELKTRKESFK